MTHGWPSEDNILELVLSFDCGLPGLNPGLQACAEAPLPLSHVTGLEYFLPWTGVWQLVDFFWVKSFCMPELTLAEHAPAF